ncbi:hypothetical protein ACHWQZ_G019096 [Mnemiopsis leidyi]
MLRFLTVLGTALVLAAAQAVSEDVRNCFEVVDAQKGKIKYTGTVSETRSGRTCQRWDSQEPHAHKKTPENFPSKDLTENYCRDPDNFGYPWCFTTDPNKKRERCEIPDCRQLDALEAEEIPTDCYKMKQSSGRNTYDVLYGGTVAETVRGIPCQKWTEQSPNLHDRTPELFPNAGLGDHNYCRDPDGTGYPWCYTTEPGVRWEGCSVPDCQDPDRNKCTDLETQQKYDLGARWAKEDPCTICECFSDRLVDCYTLDCVMMECPNGVTYLPDQCCPVCSEPCMDVRNGYIYNVNDTWAPSPCETCTCIETEEGKQEMCASQDCPPLEEGCEPNYTPGVCCPTCSEECRNKETLGYYNIGDSWNPDPCTMCECLEENGQKREMCAQYYCEMPTHCYNVTYAPDQCCPFCGDSSYDECFDMTANNTILYDGTLSETESGKECQYWTSQVPNIHTRTPENYPGGLLGYHNYCRDPDNSGYLWCYVNEEGVRWEKCDVPSCRQIVNTHNWEIEDAEVRSAVICQDTIGRVECDSDKRIVVMEANYGATKDQGCFEYSDSNFCNSTVETSESTKEKCDGKSYCDLSVLVENYGTPCETDRKYLNVTYYCKPDIPCYNTEYGFAVYNGTRSETKTGRECMRWNQQRPHGHYFTPDVFASRGIGEHNYCRDPDSEGKPWCYTMDPEKRWEFCGVPKCEGFSEERPMVMASKANNIIRLIGDAKNIDCQYVKDGDDRVTYIGQTNVTKTGRTCQRWSETTPHFHTKMPDRYPDAGLGEHNFCRDPDGNGKLWCYTMDPNKRFEYCEIPKCTDEEIEQMDLCTDVDCGVGGDCYLNKDGETSCLCKSGFMGINNTCVDIDECKRDQFVCKGDLATCVNTDGSYTCTCPDNYYWNNEECVNSSTIPDSPECNIPEFIKKPHSRYDISLGEDVIIECEGDSGDLVYWTKGLDGKMINGTRMKRSSTLTFNSIKKKDIDVYTCVVENECTGLTKIGEVDIHAKLEPCSEKGLQKYGMVWDSKDFDSAYQFCNSYGLKFAVPRSKSDSRTFIQDAWRSFHLNPNGKKFRDTPWIWVAANDRLEENEFTDVDGQPLIAPKWWPMNPDNWKGMDPRGQDEIAFHLFSGYWDDSYGFIPRPFACECNFQDSETENA